MGVTTWTQAQDQIILDGLKADDTYTEIASRLGVSKAMVSGRLYRLRKLRPADVPPKRVQTPLVPRAGTLTPLLISGKNSRVKSSDCADKYAPKPRQNKRQLRAVQSEKPTNPPVPFIELERGFCSWCVDDKAEEAGANMMCCAAPVIDKLKREGDRRASHCAYHYELSIAPEKQVSNPRRS